MGSNTISVYAKLDLKPTPLLPEDKGNRTSSDGHVQMVLLFRDVAASRTRNSRNQMNGQDQIVGRVCVGNETLG